MLRQHAFRILHGRPQAGFVLSNGMAVLRAVLKFGVRLADDPAVIVLTEIVSHYMSHKKPVLASRLALLPCLVSDASFDTKYKRNSEGDTDVPQAASLLIFCPSELRCRTFCSSSL